MTNLRDTGWDTIRLASALTFVGGFVDVVSFIGFYSLFAAQITGTMVMIGVELAGEGSALAIKLLAVPVFVLTVALTSLAIRLLRPALKTVLLLQIGLPVAFMLTAALLAPPLASDHPATLAAGMLAASAPTRPRRCA